MPVDLVAVAPQLLGDDLDVAADALEVLPGVVVPRFRQLGKREDESVPDGRLLLGPLTHELLEVAAHRVEAAGQVTDLVLPVLAPGPRLEIAVGDLPHRFGQADERPRDPARDDPDREAHQQQRGGEDRCEPDDLVADPGQRFALRDRGPDAPLGRGHRREEDPLRPALRVDDAHARAEGGHRLRELS